MISLYFRPLRDGGRDIHLYQRQRLYRPLLRQRAHPGLNRIKQKEPDCTIAVITPYKGQKRLIRETFERHKINISNRKIEIDTVDSFQGSEADVVVFCTTRARKPTPFFRDSKRINVALSRPRRELIILGNLQYFYKYGRDSSCLPALADYIRNNGNIVRMN